MFSYSIKEISSLRKETNRLLSKGISNSYLKVAIVIKWLTQSFDFLKLKKVVLQVSFWEAPTHTDIEFSNFLLQLNNQRSGSKLCVAFLLFVFLKELWHLKVKESMLFVERKYVW